jgi:hypothetical protein
MPKPSRSVAIALALEWNGKSPMPPGYDPRKINTGPTFVAAMEKANLRPDPVPADRLLRIMTAPEPGFPGRP